MKHYYLVRDKDEQSWKLKKENAERSTMVIDNKQEAMDFSISFMRENTGSLQIQKRNGEFQEERNYPRNIDPTKSKR